MFYVVGLKWDFEINLCEKSKKDMSPDMSFLDFLNEMCFVDSFVGWAVCLQTLSDQLYRVRRMGLEQQPHFATAYPDIFSDFLYFVLEIINKFLNLQKSEMMPASQKDFNKHHA